MASWLPTTSGFRLPASTVGATPPGVAIVTECPAATSSRWAVTSSSAQNPVGCSDPSFIVRLVAPVTIMRMWLICCSCSFAGVFGGSVIRRGMPRARIRAQREPRHPFGG